jgi:hypothetical protein
VGDTEAPEAMETLLFDSQFFENRVEQAAKDVRLEKWSSCPGSKDEAIFPVANEIPEHRRNGRVQVYLTECTFRLWGLHCSTVLHCH